MLDEMAGLSLTNTTGLNPLFDDQQINSISKQTANEITGVVGTNASGMSPTYHNDNNSL